MEIITVPNPVLRQKAKEVSQFDKKFFQFLRELATTLHQQHEPEGVGLAAPQVNKSWQVFVAVIAAHGNKDVFFINCIHKLSFFLPGFFQKSNIQFFFIIKIIIEIAFTGICIPDDFIN